MREITESNCIIHVKNKQYQIGKEYDNKILTSVQFNEGNVTGIGKITTEPDYCYTNKKIFKSTLDNILVEYKGAVLEEIYIHDKERLNRFISKIIKSVNYINNIKRCINFIKNVLLYKDNDCKVIIKDEDNAKIIRFNTNSSTEYTSLKQAEEIIKNINEKNAKLR
jgi:hypothetical protein